MVRGDGDVDMGEVGGGAAVEDYFVEGVVDGGFGMGDLMGRGVCGGRDGGGDGDFEPAAQEYAGTAGGTEGFS